MDYVARRLSSLPMVGGAFLAILGAGLLESAGVPSPGAMAAGFVVFFVSALAADVTLGRLIRQRGNGPW